MNQVATRNQVSYEVYVKDRSGRWEIHAHFGAAQKKQAEDEAYSLERAPHVTAVKVIREVYNYATNTSDDYVIYETRDRSGRNNSSAHSPAKAPAKAPAPAPKRPAASVPKSPRKPQPNSGIRPVTHRSSTEPEDIRLPSMVLKLMIAFCIAIAVGLAAMLVSAKALEYLPKAGVAISQGIYDKANFFAFVVGFLASVVPMLMSLTKRFSVLPRATSQSASPAMPKRTSKRAPANDISQFTRLAAEASAMTQPANPLDDIPPPAGQDTTAQDLQDTQDMAAPDETAEDKADKQDESQDIPDKPIIETPAMRRTRDKMKNFISGSISVIKRTAPELDAYHKFGVNLYVAGACDACGEQSDLQINDSRAILRDCISALGATRNMAETFCKNVDNYILEPKYKDMYGAGRESMTAFIEDENSITSSVSKALSSWTEKTGNTPKSAGGKKLHALMFTDIVNSTQKTQELGDHGAQQMVHIHNQIVRTALINNYGKEVKHMGDGIMAVFPSSASAVESAIEIQKNMASHNASQDLKFQVRIGINAGEAIAEENDLFGSVVQLAARVCAQAGGDEILVSENVKNTYAGSRAAFTSMGTRQMKGFSDPIEVFAATSRM